MFVSIVLNIVKQLQLKFLHDWHPLSCDVWAGLKMGVNLVGFFSNWVVGLNGTLRLLISGCDVELCDFELSLWSRWSNQQLFDQSQLYQLTLGFCDWGQRAILGGQLDTLWSIGYCVYGYLEKLGGQTQF